MLTIAALALTAPDNARFYNLLSQLDEQVDIQLGHRFERMQEEAPVEASVEISGQPAMAFDLTTGVDTPAFMQIATDAAYNSESSCQHSIRIFVYLVEVNQHLHTSFSRRSCRVLSCV